MNNPCEIVRDLLPLSRDQSLSPQSELFVQSHLSSCRSCKEMQKTMNQFDRWSVFDRGLKKVPAISETEQIFIRELKAWRMRTSVIGGVVLAVLFMSLWYLQL